MALGAAAGLDARHQQGVQRLLLAICMGLQLHDDVLVGLFLITLFDVHTSRRLAPLFCAAFALVPVTGFVLPLRLPSDVGWIARRGWLEPLLMSIGGSLGLVMAVVQGCGGSTLQLRRLASLLFGASLVFFVGCFVVRFVRATGRDREVLRVLLVSLVPALAILGLAFILTVLSLRETCKASRARPRASIQGHRGLWCCRFRCEFGTTSWGCCR